MKERATLALLAMCSRDDQIIEGDSTNRNIRVAGKYISYGLCAIADAICELVEVYFDRRGKQRN